MRVIVTRPEEHAAELVERLVALGHEPVLCPLVRIEPLGEGAPVDVAGYDWVVVTSRTGAAALARRARGELPRVAAIGPGTAAELAVHGITAALVPEVSTQEGLVAAFPRPAGRVLFAGAEGARRVVVDELGADFVALYRTVPATPPGGLPAGDMVVVASPSAARALAGIWAVPGGVGGAPAPADASAGARAPAVVPAVAPATARPVVVSIGPQTSAAARAAGLPVDVEADSFNLDGLVAAVVRASALAAVRGACPQESRPGRPAPAEPAP